jgi:hypothetical protein
MRLAVAAVGLFLAGLALATGLNGYRYETVVLVALALLCFVGVAR